MAERNGLFRAHRYHLELKRTYLVILQDVPSGLVHELTRTENKLLQSYFATCKRRFLTNRTRKGVKNRYAHVCVCVWGGGGGVLLRFGFPLNHPHKDTPPQNPRDKTGFQARSRGGTWSWTLKLAQKRSWAGRWSWAEKVGLLLLRVVPQQQCNGHCPCDSAQLRNGEGTPP